MESVGCVMVLRRLLFGAFVLATFCRLLLVECQQFPQDVPSIPASSLEVQTQAGHVRGTLLRSRNGRDIYAFRGIPYATSPIGPLRFKPPVRITPWGRVLDTANFKSSCPQTDPTGRNTGIEDCLFLNVFTPSLPNRPFGGSVGPSSFPVMVFLHGGRFESGSSALYGGEPLVEKGVVLVTMNYRLGILGFFSTGDEAAAGNYGLLDQKMALEWVRDNIRAFGGDPNSVTLFGQEAGAASVTLHMMSPLVQGLFHRAILQSGSALCDWAIEPQPVQYARDIARRLNCRDDDSISIVECLRSKSTSEILRAQGEGKRFGNFPLRAVPVVQKSGAERFLPEEPLILMQRREFKNIPVIGGINKDETAFFIPYLALTNGDYIRDSPYFLKDTLLPRFLESATSLSGNIETVVQGVVGEYFGGINTRNFTQVIKPFVNMSTDAMYMTCMQVTMRAFAQAEVPTYFYVFEYRGEKSIVDLQVGNRPPVDIGVANGDELQYLFNININNLQTTTRLDDIISNRMTRLWTDFAKTGTAPEIQDYEFPQWQQYTPENQAFYRISGQLTMDTNYRQRQLGYWIRNLPSLGGLSYDPWNESLTSDPSYKSLAWAMVGVTCALLLLIVILIVVILAQKKRQSYKAGGNSPNSSVS